MINRKSDEHSDDVELRPWLELLQRLSQGSMNLTVGLISGSRLPSERRVLERLAQSGLAASSESPSSGLSGNGLLVRLKLGNEMAVRRALRTAKAADQIPSPAESTLGRWFDVAVSMRLGASAPRNLELLPRWLSQWKRQFARILIDLGPIDQPICRTLGRYCDTSLILLGPETCASPIWLKRHIEHLTQCDAALAGSIEISCKRDAA